MLSEFNWLQATMTSPIFLALIGFSIVTFGVAIERVYYYWKRRGNPDETARQVSERVRAGQMKEAAWSCEQCAHPLGPIALVLFRNPGATPETIDERMHITLSQQKMLLERNLNVLGTMAAVSPLVGLLGTVVGIMRAFHDMARVGAAAPSVVASGVAEALVTTVAGLVVAVPALMLYNHFTRRMNVMLTVAENQTRTIRATIAEASQGRNTGAKGEARRSARGHVETPAAVPETAPVG